MGNNGTLPYQITLLQPPPAVLTASIQSGPVTVTTGTPVPLDNTPSPVSTGYQSAAAVDAIAQSPMVVPVRRTGFVAGADMNSADPLALQAGGAVRQWRRSSVTLDGHSSYVDTNTQAIDAPTMIRTGTGSIDIAAASNLTLADPTAPGVIYTAGAPATGSPQLSSARIVVGQSTQNGSYDLLATDAVNPDAARGDISIHAQNDITSLESVTGREWL